MFTTNMPRKPLHAQTAEGSSKHVQSKQQRHQNYIIDIVMVSSSPTPKISHTPSKYHHFRIQEGKRPLGHNKLL